MWYYKQKNSGRSCDYKIKDYKKDKCNDECKSYQIWESIFPWQKTGPSILAKLVPQYKNN